MFSFLFPTSYSVEDLFSSAKDSKQDDFLKAFAHLREKVRADELIQCFDSRGWTIFQYLATNGMALAMHEFLGFVESNVANSTLLTALELEGSSGHTALLLSAVNGHEDITCAFLRRGASFAGVTGRQRNCVYILARNGMTDALKLIYNTRSPDALAALGNAQDSNGYTALHAAALMGHSETCRMLLACGVDGVGGATRDGSTALHIACRLSTNQPSAAKSAATVHVLLEHYLTHQAVGLEGGASPLATADCFGSTPLHIAASCSNDHAVQAIVALVSGNMTSVIAQDNDGYHATHIACHTLGRLLDEWSREPADGDMEEKVSAAGRCLALLVTAGYPVSATDYAKCTVLHALGVSAHLAGVHGGDHLLQAVQVVLDHTPTEEVDRLVGKENSNGWTCLHVALSKETGASHDTSNKNVSMELRSRVSETFLAAFDPDKRKADEGREGSMVSRLRCGAHNRIPLQERIDLLGRDYSSRGVCAFLRGLGRPPRVVVVAGAGISTSAGIKDFRSSDGLYANSSTSQLFSMEYLIGEPEAFFLQMKGLFLPVVDGQVMPTKAHALLRLLSDLGWLTRVYTQNIDMLEQRIGLSSMEVVECHGSCSRAYCTNEECELRDWKIDSDEEMERLFWSKVRAIDSDAAGEAGKKSCPRCEACGALLRPDVTFFGEPLPVSFGASSMQDLPHCDLVLVLGTSLVVYPVASLPQMVGPKAVRMLINREPTGCFQFVRPADIETQAIATPENVASVLAEEKESYHRWETSQYRDVFRQGDCDAGAEEFVRALGMSDAFDRIVREYCPQYGA
jgi:NAD+-dependent protein deacetylase sirtuin 2